MVLFSVSAKPEKQTKVWKTKTGLKIRICDMSDSHVLNTIRYLERCSQVATGLLISEAWRALDFLQGEVAIDSVEAEIRYLEAEGLEPSEISPLYDNFLQEAACRNLDLGKVVG